MMAPLNREQAQALTALLASLRSTWDAAGIMSALGKAKTMGTATEVAIAALKAASKDTNRTPAVIAMQGDHWTTGEATTNPHRDEPCPVHDHIRPAWNCVCCRSEWLGSGTWPTGSKHQDARHEQPDPEPYTDARLAAAGGDR